MKPKDLKCPFRWDTRRPLLQGNVLFVPEYYQDHTSFKMPPFNEIFGNDKPIAIEFCSGNGEWIAQKAIDHPEINWIACEIQFKRVRKIWSKSQNRGLENLFVVCGDGLTFSRYYVGDASVEKIFVNFPDPWPKERHAKHRIIQEPFAKELRRISKPGAEITFVTDDAPYALQMQSVMQGWSGDAPQIIDESHGPSFFDRLWRSKGRQIQMLKYVH